MNRGTRSVVVVAAVVTLPLTGCGARQAMAWRTSPRPKYSRTLPPR